MAIEDRRLRDGAARRRLITTTARNLAESEGWDAVTTRRLSTEIEYSQPVLYKHFGSMDDIVEAAARGIQRAARGSRHRCYCARRRHSHRGPLGSAARIGHARPQQSATPWA